MEGLVPERFHFSHDFCVALHALLTGILVTGEEAGIFNIEIPLEDDADASDFVDRSGEEVFEWLENSGREELVRELVYKQVCAALLSDMCHFIYEALECSRKGKLAVAFALLRKPLKENLFYLEWLLADPGWFLSIFSLGDIKSLEVSRGFTPQQKKAIIGAAMENTKLGAWFSPEFMYEIRYDKSVEYGFEKLWQKANHLITTYRYLETEAQNFNFVFSGDESSESQWQSLYSFLPMVLFHAWAVVEAVVGLFAECQDEEFTQLRMYIGMFLWMEDGPIAAPTAAIRREMIESITEGITLVCGKCEHEVEWDKTNLRRFYESGSLACSNCGYTVSVIGTPDETPDEAAVGDTAP